MPEWKAFHLVARESSCRILRIGKRLLPYRFAWRNDDSGLSQCSRRSKSLMKSPKDRKVYPRLALRPASFLAWLLTGGFRAT